VFVELAHKQPTAEAGKVDAATAQIYFHTRLSLVA
jgi:hypothetical protein